MNIIDINSPVAVANLALDVRDKIDAIQQNLNSISSALSVIADPAAPENKSSDPFDLLSFSKEDAREAIENLCKKL
jgi:hypothetical protein